VGGEGYYIGTLALIMALATLCLPAYPADQADRVVEGVFLIPESQVTCLITGKDKPLQPTCELEASVVRD